ncbi:Putative Serine/threonine protein kinase [Rhizopus microsporus]|nr:Putative Serine/threonine protein kinase [Rhizopus microsporus]
MMDESEIDRIYSQQLHDELQSQTKTAVTQLIELYPEIFGLDRLIAPKNQYIQQQNLNEAIAQTVRDTCLAYIESGVDFDHALDWVLVWRQQLSFKLLGEKYGQEQVIASIGHPRARKAVQHIYQEGLDKYMQWFPWSWFSRMQFIGAGGFSAVYSVTMTPAYDFQPVKMALKIVDDKILNESRAFLPLLFQGLTVCETTGDLMMVMKFSNDGNLEDHMAQLPLGDLDLKTITGTILRLAANLADLHKVGICHRNVHPRNIVCTDSDYFLVDYRFATPARESSSVTAITKAVYGRLPYVAPEVRQGVYTEKSDIYSLGVIIWQLVSKVIFPSSDVLLDGNHKNGAPEDHVYRVEPVPGLPEWYQRLYVACMEPRPENRPNANDICTALQPIHDVLEFSVPLDRRVTGYIVARRAEVADHLRTYAKVKGTISDSTTRLYTLSSLPSTQSFILLPFESQPFNAVWNSNSCVLDTFSLSAYIDTSSSS